MPPLGQLYLLLDVFQSVELGAFDHVDLVLHFSGLHFVVAAV
jgi:hypothetical protein